MTPSDEFLIIEAQNGVVGVQEVRMEDNLNAIVMSIEQLHSAYLVEDRVTGIVCHVVGGDWWEGITL